MAIDKHQLHNGSITDIIFDLGGVLIDLNMKALPEACMQIGISPELFFVKADSENTSTVCQGVSASRVITDYQVGGVTTDALLERVLTLCPAGVTKEQVIEAWNACLGTIPRERLDLIRELRKRGYRTHLLSNTNDLHWQFIVDKYFSEEGYTCQDLFDQVFVSHEVRLAKPDPEIYRHALRCIGSQPEQCLFIDDAEANTDAACAEGIRGEWLDLTKEDVIGLVQRILQD